jgi:hypothetical protein
VRRLAALLCVVALGVLAEEPPSPAGEGAAAKPASPAASAPASGEQPAPAKAGAAAAGAGKSPERFDPSEQISEDLSVSFPADI